MLYQTGYSVWPDLLVSEIRLMKLSICFYFQFFPAIGSSANIATLLIIALDRLLCIVYPQRYPIVNKHTYSVCPFKHTKMLTDKYKNDFTKIPHFHHFN
uniref:G-protein coupled receptors family 1 profile domain-containing protein n=1 Tax=Ditylenchus dipsaci TaxID=166011 RepID=A0A915DR89_9BILA